MPTLHYGSLTIRFRRKDFIPKEQLCEMIKTHSISGVNPSYKLVEGGNMFEYQMAVRTQDTENFRRLADDLRDMESVHEFGIVPTGD